MDTGVVIVVTVTNNEPNLSLQILSEVSTIYSVQPVSESHTVDLNVTSTKELSDAFSSSTSSALITLTTTYVTTYVTTFDNRQVSTVTSTVTTVICEDSSITTSISPSIVEVTGTSSTLNVTEIPTVPEGGSTFNVTVTSKSPEVPTSADLSIEDDDFPSLLPTSFMRSGNNGSGIVYITDFVTTYGNGSVATMSLSVDELESGVILSVTTLVLPPTTLPPNPTAAANDTAAKIPEVITRNYNASLTTLDSYVSTVPSHVDPAVITSLGVTDTADLGPNCIAPYTPGQLVNPTIGFEATVYVTECCEHKCVRQTETHTPVIPLVTVTETGVCVESKCSTNTEVCNYCTFTTSMATQTTVVRGSTLTVYSPCPTVEVPQTVPPMVTITEPVTPTPIAGVVTSLSVTNVVKTVPKGGYEPLTAMITYHETCPGFCSPAAQSAKVAVTANPKAPNQVVCSDICTTMGPPPAVCSQGQCVTTAYPTITCVEEVCHPIVTESKPDAMSPLNSIPDSKTIAIPISDLNWVTSTKSHGTVSCNGTTCQTTGPAPVICAGPACTTVEYPTVSCASQGCTTIPVPHVTIKPTSMAVTVPVVPTVINSHGTVSCIKSRCETHGPAPSLCIDQHCTTIAYPTVNCISDICSTVPVPDVTMPASCEMNSQPQIVYVTTEVNTCATTQSHGTVTCNRGCKTEGPAPVVCVGSECTTIAYPTVTCTEDTCHTVPAPQVTPVVTQTVTHTTPLPATVYHPVACENPQTFEPSSVQPIPTTFTMTTHSYGQVICTQEECETHGPAPVICGGPWCTTVERPVITCGSTCETVSTVPPITFTPTQVVTFGTAKGAQPTSLVCVGTECFTQPQQPSLAPVPTVTGEIQLPSASAPVPTVNIESQPPPALQPSTMVAPSPPALSRPEAAQGMGSLLSAPLFSIMGLSIGVLLF